MAAKKKSIPTKSDFIRSQSADLSAAEVVEKAKSEGLSIEPGLVYNVRGQAKASGKATAKTKGKPDKVAAKKASSTSHGARTEPAQGKASFVRAHSALAPKEIVEKAKAQGIKLEVGYVYNVRSADKGARTKPSVPRKTTSKPVAANGHPSSSAAANNEEELLKIVAAEIGLGRSIEILARERARVHAVIGA
jgi:hypothetical protein